MPWTWNAVWKVLQTQSRRSGLVCALASGRISANFPKSGEASVVVMVCCETICPSTTWEGTQTPHICMTWTWDAFCKVLQPRSKHSGKFCTLASGSISANFPKSGEVSVVCGGNGVSVKPYAHPQPEKVLKHLTYVWHRRGMQFERLYSLNQSIVALLKKNSIDGKQYLEYLWEPRGLSCYIEVMLASMWARSGDGLSIPDNLGIYTPLRQHAQCGENNVQLKDIHMINMEKW
jgi:hypothetical protein